MTEPRVPVVVLASGRGSGFAALARAAKAGKIPAEIRALVCDKPNAPVLALAREAGIEAILVPVPQGMPREKHDEAVLAAIKKFDPRWLVMAGYMRLVTRKFFAPFVDPRGFNRVVNIHPSLLPAFPGVDGYGQAFRYGAKVSGATVHLVSDGLDDGPICAQESFSILDCVNEEAVAVRGLPVEHRLYPEALAWLLTERFTVEKNVEGRLCVRPN